MTDLAKIQLPRFSTDVHHEAELAVRLDQNLNPSHFTLALDLTARDLQAQAKQTGQPWTLSKSFAGACPVGKWLMLPKTGLAGLTFSLKVNGQVRQVGQADQMIFKLEQVRDYLRSRFHVLPGDVILTGTPEGVGPLRAGDHVEGEIQGHLKVEWFVMTPIV
jgi:2-keto-4-pentenoate hydratase/2-oxohepta-3-ene-1,7-dioic acid hydratase in catechol pathway